MSYDRFLLRREFFGGLLVDRHTSTSYVVSPMAVDVLLDLSRMTLSEYRLSLQRVSDSVLTCLDEVISTLKEFGIVGEHIAEFQFVDAEPGEYLGALAAPLKVFWNLTDACNYRCLHCCVHAQSDGDSFPRDVALQICRDLAKMGVCEIALAGGEPFLYPHIFDVIECAAEMGLLITITTNGSLVNPNVAERLASFRGILRYVHVSLDGPPGVNDHIRGKGAFARTVDALRLLEAVGIEAAAQVTLTAWLQGEERNLIDSLVSAGISRMSMSTIRPSGTALQNPGMMLGFDGAKTIRRTVENLAREAGITVFGGRSDSLSRTLWDYMNVRPCGAGWMALTIHADGSVYPCNFLVDYLRAISISPGNVYADNLTAIWKTAEAFTYVRTKALTSRCTSCSSFNNDCKGQCPSLRIEEHQPALSGRLLCSRSCPLN